jgi:hypothetical protein
VHIITIIVALLLIAIAVSDAFATIILPRRVNGRFRLTVLFYRYTWKAWSAAARHSTRRRETYLSLFGPLSLIILLIIWAAMLIVGFGLLQWGAGSHIATAAGRHTLGDDLHMSGSNFFTLGLGDVQPQTAIARLITIIEAGVGFGFLGLVITYLPILYQSFSRREVQISLLDSRAGSPPRAVELLRRIGIYNDRASLEAMMREWDHWSAELLESHLSYPAVAFFRSQHDNQSWLATVTLIMDVTALVQVGVDSVPKGPARNAFAMARHAVVDLCQYLNTPPIKPKMDRLPLSEMPALRDILAEANIPLREGEEADKYLRYLRHLYEPFVHGIAEGLLLTLPPFMPDPAARDNWETTAWDDVL